MPETLLSLKVAGEVLFALDVAAEHVDLGNDGRQQVLKIRQLVTSKLWPGVKSQRVVYELSVSDGSRINLS